MYAAAGRSQGWRHGGAPSARHPALAAVVFRVGHAAAAVAPRTSHHPPTLTLQRRRRGRPRGAPGPRQPDRRDVRRRRARFGGPGSSAGASDSTVVCARPRIVMISGFSAIDTVVPRRTCPRRVRGPWADTSRTSTPLTLCPHVQTLGGGRVDVSVGSALDIFGGDLRFDDVVAWSRRAATETSPRRMPT